MTAIHKPHVPAIWRELRPGDRVFSAKPYHALQAAAEAIYPVVIRFEPAPRGYWCICESVPQSEVPHDH